MGLQLFSKGAIDERQAAVYLGCSVSALRAWRSRKQGPAFIRVGRLIRYTSYDLEQFLESHRVDPTEVKSRDQ